MKPVAEWSNEEVAARIQFTDVNADLTRAGITAHLERCLEHRFQAAMISPCWVKLAKGVLAGSGVKIATTVNFPQATDTAAMKAAVVPLLAEDGADEFDFPPNPAYLLSGMDDDYAAEIAAVVEAAPAHGLIVKAMLEFGYLPDDATKRKAVTLASQAGVDYVKNSSGWGKGGSAATVEDTRLLAECATGATKVKVSGKVNSREKFNALFEAGAVLCGTSSGPAILAGSSGDADAY